MFLAVLNRALGNLGWRFIPGGASPEENRDIAEKLNRLQSAIDLGRSMEKTQLTMALQGIRFRISKEGLPEIELKFHDPPGELFEPSATAETYRDQRHVVFESMQGCSGLLFLVDINMGPDWARRCFEFTIQEFIRFLHEKHVQDRFVAGQPGLLDLRAAILLTKADTLPWLRRHRTRDARPWVEAQGGFGELSAKTHKYCREIRFYFCSSFGWQDGRPDLRTVVRPRPIEFEHRPPQELIPDPAAGKDDEAHADGPGIGQARPAPPPPDADVRQPDAAERRIGRVGAALWRPGPAAADQPPVEYGPAAAVEHRRAIALGRDRGRRGLTQPGREG
jgi:hypothetical protein